MGCEKIRHDTLFPRVFPNCTASGTDAAGWKRKTSKRVNCEVIFDFFGEQSVDGLYVARG